MPNSQRMASVGNGTTCRDSLIHLVTEVWGTCVVLVSSRLPCLSVGLLCHSGAPMDCNMIHPSMPLPCLQLMPHACICSMLQTPRPHTLLLLSRLQVMPQLLNYLDLDVEDPQALDW